MRRKVSKEWEEMGPAAPQHCGPLGERHSKGHHSVFPLDNDPQPRGATFSERGHRPMQFSPWAEIEVIYND